MLVGGAAVAAGIAANVASSSNSAGSSDTSHEEKNRPMSDRMPVIFVPHGGGPYSYVELGFPADEVEDLASYWRNLAATLPRRPDAVLVVSAHWEEPVPTLMTTERPPMLYDYYGFPPEAYELQWPAPGAPELAGRVRSLLSDAGIATAENDERGFDHGTFVPLGRVFPEAEIPTMQLSLKAGLDPEEHLALGRALAPLRDEGVLILGSGMSYHNMRGFWRADAAAHASAFDEWLGDTVTRTSAERDAGLVAWQDAPMARAVHPREEHLLPLMVIAGAAGDDVGVVPWRGRVSGKAVSAVRFG